MFVRLLQSWYLKPEHTNFLTYEFINKLFAGILSVPSFEMCATDVFIMIRTRFEWTHIANLLNFSREREKDRYEGRKTDREFERERERERRSYVLETDYSAFNTKPPEEWWNLQRDDLPYIILLNSITVQK